MFEINSHPINYTPFIWELDNLWISSFSSEINWTYAILSSLWNIFNFNSICYQKYWNWLLEHNFDDLPSISISKYDTPLRNWWIVENTRFDEFIFNIKFFITSDNLLNLEKEISDIKTTFNSKIKLYKKNLEKDNYINVKITDLKIDKKLLSWTNIDVSFISMDPFWGESNWATQFFEELSWNLDTTLIINDSSHEVDLWVIIQVSELTGLINKTILNLNWYEIEINKVLNNWDIIVLEKKTWYLFINWIRNTYRWNLLPFPILTPWQFSITFDGWWTMDLYNTYILYDKIIL